MHHEVIHLRNEVSRLQNIRGRPHLQILAVDMRDFERLFGESEELRLAWIKLIGNYKPNGVEALIRLFLAKSPRFWKILPDRQNVEVRGWFGGIRTHNEIHEYPLTEVAAEIYSYIAMIIACNLGRMGFSEDDEKFKLDAAFDIQDTKGIKGFLLNSFQIEANRRITNGPVTYHSICIQI